MMVLCKKFNILVTASGLSPVGINTVLSLKKHINKIIGVDIDSDNTGKYFCDKFYQVPLACNKSYVHIIKQICKKEKVDVIFPLTVEEIIELLNNKDIFDSEKITIAVNNSLVNIQICNDKWLTNQFLKDKKIAVPKAYPSNNINELVRDVKKLGYPKRDIVFKPRVTHGSRGFRILSNRFDSHELLINQKPTDNIYITLEQLIEILRNKKPFPNIMVMDYLEGDDYSVYSFCDEGEGLVVIPMKRSGLLPGMSLGGEIVKDKKIISYIKSI